MIRTDLLASVGMALASLIFAGGPVYAGPPPEFSPPGVYGRIDHRRYPRPITVASSPTMPSTAQKKHGGPTAFLWVPVSHRLQWLEYCPRYGACGLSVAFVSDHWYFHHGPGKGLPHEDEDKHGH